MGFTVLPFHFRMGHEEAQDRAPEVGVFNSLTERADGDFADKLLIASESSGLTITQGLRRCVVVPRLKAPFVIRLKTRTQA